MEGFWFGVVLAAKNTKGAKERRESCRGEVVVVEWRVKIPIYN